MVVGAFTLVIILGFVYKILNERTEENLAIVSRQW